MAWTKKVCVHFSLLSAIRRLKLYVSSRLSSQEKYQSTEVLTNIVKSTWLFGHRPVLCFFSKPGLLTSFLSGIRSLATASCLSNTLKFSVKISGRSQTHRVKRFWWKQSFVLSIVKALAVPGVHCVLIHKGPKSPSKHKRELERSTSFWDQSEVALKDYVLVGAWRRAFTSWQVRGGRDT